MKHSIVRSTRLTIVVCVSFIMAGLPAITSAQDLSGGQPGSATLLYRITDVEWQHMGGPPGGRGYDIRHTWDDHDTWLVTDTFSGVSISSDRGVTWTPSNHGMYIPARSGANDIYSLTVDPNDPRIVWAGTTGPGHFYRSSDGGLTWVRADLTILGLQGEPLTLGAGYGIRGFTIEPGNSDVVYAMGHVASFRLLSDDDMTQYNLDRDAHGGRIFRTTDGGATWTLIWEGRALTRNLIVDPRDTDKLWVTTGIQDIVALDTPEISSGLNCGGVGLLHSSDGGLTWQELGPHVSTPGINSTTIGTIDMSASDPDTMIAGGGSDMCPAEPPAGQHGGVYLTNDGGGSWTLVLQDDIISSVDFCDLDPDRVYAVSTNAFHRSDDGGHTWTSTSNVTGGWGPAGIVTGFPIDTETDPDDCDRVMVNTYTGGVFLTDDGGSSFQLSSDGYAGSFISGLWIDPFDSEHVLVSSEMSPFELVAAGDEYSWNGMVTPPLQGGTAMLAASTAYPSDPTALLVASPGKISPIGPLAIYRRTIDGGWSEHRPTLVSSVEPNSLKITDIQYAPTDPQRVYAATAQISEFSDIPLGDGGGLLFSVDGGSTWTNSQDFSEDGFMRVAVHPQDATTAWAVGIHAAGVVKTTDGGVSWSAMAPQNQHHLNAVAVPAHDPTQIWIGGEAGLMVWDGDAWSPRNRGLPELAHISVITFDAAHPGIVYVGTFFHGIFVSTDMGESFRRIDIELPRLRGEPLCVEHLALSPDGSVLYTGGHSAGLWRADLTIADYRATSVVD